MTGRIRSVSSSSNNQSGMTLIEVLLSLTVLFVSAAVIVNVMPLWKGEDATSKQEIQLFFQQLQDDMNYAYEVEADPNGMKIMEYRDEREYTLSRGSIIRRKNGTGHEIVLQDVQGFSVEPAVYGAEVSVIDNKGVTWSTVIGKRPLTEGENDYWVKREP
ncbi:competence type IV pilus minor pilin ComGF [Salibacterium sp. K-3]